VAVAVNGAPQVVWQAARGQPQSFSLPVDAANVDCSPLRVTFTISTPCAPIEFGDGNDFRRLGLGLRSLRIEPA
jgi:hypothetical protein